MQESRYFHIGSRRYEFNDEDFIFYVDGATPSRNIESGRA